MSEKRFLETLQALLTMVNPESPTSIACVKSALENIYALAQESGKCDPQTQRVIHNAIKQINRLIRFRGDFAGIPGDYDGNVAKRKHLKAMLSPGC